MPDALDPALEAALLPCPFCGKIDCLWFKPYRADDDGGEPFDWGFNVQCNASGIDSDPRRGCGAFGSWGETKEEAIAAWNTRASPQAEIDRLREARLSVGLESGQLVIRIGLDILAHAIMFAPSLSHFDETVSDDVLEPTITDADKFFKDLVLALEREEEDGTTPVHRLLDAAALDAIENGAEGIETGWDKADKLRADLRALHPETPNGGQNA